MHSKAYLSISMKIPLAKCTLSIKSKSSYVVSVPVYYYIVLLLR